MATSIGDTSSAKIVHFGKYYPPDAGGIESVTRSLAVGARAFRHKVSVVCFALGCPDEEETVDGVQLVRAPISRTVASQPLGGAYFIQCLRHARSAELVHVHTPNMLAAFCALFLGHKTRVLVHWHSDTVNKGWLGKLVQPLELALLRRADVIIGSSSAYVSASRALRLFADKVRVIPYGVKKTVLDAGFMDETQTLKRQLANRKVVLSVGRLVPYKGIDVLITAAGTLDENTSVVIVGDGPLRNELQSLIERLDLTGKVFLVGRLSDAALSWMFTRASVFCLPSVSRAEAFGVVLLEAMSFGLPIVASDINGSGVQWVNQDGVTGYNVPVGSPEALALACRQILDSEELHAVFSTAAYQRFLSEFTEEVFVDSMMKVYAELLA